MMTKANVFTRTLVLSLVLLLAGIAMLAAQILLPNVILPRFTYTLMVQLSVLSFAIDAVVNGRFKGFCPLTFVTGALSFAVFGGTMGLVALTAADLLLAALVGGVVCLVSATLFDSILDRLSSGARKNSKVVPFAVAILMMLAVESLAGMYL